MKKSDLKNKLNTNNLEKEDIMENLIISKELENINNNTNKNVIENKNTANAKKSNKNLMYKKTFLIDMFDKENKNKNKNYIQDILNEFIGRDSLIKRTYSMPDLSYRNLFITKTKDERQPSSKQDKKSHIKELNNLNAIIGLTNDKIIEDQNDDDDENDENRMSTINIDQNININENINSNNNKNVKKKVEDEDEDIEIDGDGDGDEEEYKKSRTNLRARSFYIEKNMTSSYYEENEHKNNNIIFNNNTNKIECISSNLMLKKIIFEDFLKKQADIIYYFCQQCFCFLNIEIFFEKILNCYKYYRKKNIPIEKILNLIDFLNALIIEMFEYYKGEPDFDIQLIKNIYNKIISDLIINNNNNCNGETLLDKNEVINLNLDANIEEEDYKKKFAIFNKEKDNQNEEKEESIFFDKDYIVIEKDKDSFDIYNEEKEFNKLIYTTFIQDTFGSSKAVINQNYDFSIINPIEKLIINLKDFLYIFKSKKISYNLLVTARNSIFFYKNLKNEEQKKQKEDNINFNFLRKSKCLTSNETFLMNDKNFNQRKHLHKGFFSILDWKPDEIGEELIRVSKKLLKKVEKRELYKAIYLKKDKDIKSPNVIKCINSFNKLTFFIIEDIISYDHASDRAKVIDKWAQIAEYCKSRNDFNDCIAINSALNSYIITGLNLTNKQLKNYTNTLIKDIKKFCSCYGNYKYIREKIKDLNNKNEIYYPYLGMMLRDITFLEESSKYLVDGELINFGKIENVQNIMESNFRFKIEESKKKDKKNNNIEELNFFEDLEMNTEENLESIANQVEPNFTLNDGKKEFKRMTKIDEKYFNQYKDPLFLRKSSTSSINNLFRLGK